MSSVIIPPGRTRTDIRRVVMIMPFGGSDQKASQRSKVEFWRFKAVFQAMNARPQPEGIKVEYQLEVYNLDVGDIADRILQAIGDADILVALITEKNTNVLYELAVGTFVKSALIIVAKVPPIDNLPLYLNQLAYIPYDDVTPQRIASLLERTAREADQGAAYKAPPPEALLSSVEDDPLMHRLGTALEQLEAEGPPNTPAFINRLFRYLDPRTFLPNWTFYYPYCVLKFRWRQMSHAPIKYLPEDTDSEDPIVYVANKDFFNLFQLEGFEEAPKPSQRQLSYSDVLDHLVARGLVNQDSDGTGDPRIGFMRLREAIINNSIDLAKKPIRFTAGHTEFPNGAVFPVVVTKRVVGEDRRRPHATYVLVIYLPLPS